MARSWLEVTTDEVQSKMGAGERLAERRKTVGERARTVVADMAAPVFRQAAESQGWDYIEEHDTEWSIVRCGIHESGDVERDPRVAFRVAEFDAYQPLVVLRAKAGGAAVRPTSTILPLDDLDEARLREFVDGT